MSDGRHLKTADGAPFFWMGDTAWFLPKLSQSQISTYFQDRSQKGFNVSLIELGYYYFEPIGPAPFINGDSDQFNETYWSKVDWMIQEADNRGVYAALTVMWGNDYNTVFNGDSARARRLGQKLGQRYGGRDNVIWIVSGEYDSINGYSWPVNSSQRAMFDALAQGIRTGGGGQLMTIHPGTSMTSGREWNNYSWLNINMLQSGHQSDNQVYGHPENHELIDEDLARSPLRPVVDGESAYEDKPDGYYEIHDLNAPRMGANTIRRKAYWAVFAGALGHTYGHDALQVMWINGQSLWPRDYSCVDWTTALNAAGGNQMIHLRNLMESHSFAKARPNQSLVTSSQGSGLSRARSLTANDGSYALLYIPDGRSMTVDMAKITSASNVKASWFDPRTGAYSSAGSFANSGVRSFDAPGATASGNDWVLLLEGSAATPATDLNGDGVTNISDVQLGVNQALGISVCGGGDINHDGSCNVMDIQVIVNKALGL